MTSAPASSAPLASLAPLTAHDVVVSALRDDGPSEPSRAAPLTIARALMVSVAGAALYGVALGSFGGSPSQMLSSALKAPMLLLGTTALCFPAFYVLQLTRAAHPLSLVQALSVKAGALAATALWWGALSLPLSFLASTAQHYRLAQVLALAVGATGGVVGMMRFKAQLEARCGPAAPGTLAGYMAVFGVVGAQLSWFLRPFVGAPDQPFALVRGLEGNVFSFVFGALLGGSGWS